MKKFKFNLEKLLTYKHQILESEMQRLSMILSEMHQVELEIGRLNTELRRAGEDLAKKMAESVSPVECQTYQNFIDKTREDIKKAEKRLVDLNLERERQIDRIADAKKEHRALEILKENQYRAYLEENRKATEREIEEFISARESAQQDEEFEEQRQGD